MRAFLFGALNDSADEFPILHLRLGEEVFLLGDSSITRVR